MHPTYYRGCWHVVSRCLFERYTHPKACSRSKAVYNPKAVIPHAASLHQACAHCAIFPTAASRRSLGRISVPMWPVALSGRLPVVGSVGRYPAVKLIGRDPIPYRYNLSRHPMRGVGASGITTRFQELFRCMGQVGHALLTRSPLSPRSKLLGSRSTCMC